MHSARFCRPCNTVLARVCLVASSLTEIGVRCCNGQFSKHMHAIPPSVSKHHKREKSAARTKGVCEISSANIEAACERCNMNQEHGFRAAPPPKLCCACTRLKLCKFNRHPLTCVCVCDYWWSGRYKKISSEGRRPVY